MNADLHTHSTASDGTLRPAELVRLAHANGVELLAVTDHDGTAGLAEAADEAARLGVRLVPGVEISVTWAAGTIHVVGLNFDPADARLEAGLAANRAGREARARAIGERLAAAGIPGAWEGALREAGAPGRVTRTHFARDLADRGVCPDAAAAFERYLAPGRPGHVPQRWAALSEAIGWIRDAGGSAVLAHPWSCALGDVGLSALLSEFRDLGGHAIEIVGGGHAWPRFAREAVRLGLRGSCGSDFHAPVPDRAGPGRLPALPSGVDPVWSGW